MVDARRKQMWEVFSCDSWFNHTDGWWVNDVMSITHIITNAGATDEELLAKLKEVNVLVPSCTLSDIEMRDLSEKVKEISMAYKEGDMHSHMPVVQLHKEAMRPYRIK